MSARPNVSGLRDRQGHAAVYSVTATARRLPMADAEARRWLSEHGLIYSILGRQMCVWGDVLDTIRGQGAPELSSPEIDLRHSQRLRRG